MSTDLMKGSLWANALFSATSGLLLVVAGGPLSRWMDVPQLLLILTGLGLIGFAAVVARLAIRSHNGGIRMVIRADIAWVLASAGLIVAFPEAASPQGRLAIGAVAVVVLTLAVAQTVGLRRQAQPV